MLNILNMTEEEIRAAYVKAIADILSTSAIRWTRIYGGGKIAVRLWNGTAGFTVACPTDFRTVHDYTVDQMVAHISKTLTHTFRAVYMLDHGATGDIDNPLGGRSPSEWGRDPEHYAWGLDLAIRQKLKEAIHGNTTLTVATIAALPRVRQLAAQVLAQYVAKAPAAREAYVRGLLMDMQTPLAKLVKEGVSKEDILSGVATMIDVLQAAPTVDPLSALVASHVNQTEVQRAKFMRRIREEVGTGTHIPGEWAWCFDRLAGTVCVGQLADGECTNLVLTDEDIAFIRALCEPREMDTVTIGRLVDGGG